MTTTTLTSNDELQAVKLLAADHSLYFVATALQMTEEKVREIGERYGYPDNAKLNWAVDELTRGIDLAERASIPQSITAGAAARVERATTPRPKATSTPPLRSVPKAPAETTSTSSTEVAPVEVDLLERAAASGRKRTRSLGERITAELVDLRDRLADEDRERAEIAEREKARQVVLDELAQAEEALRVAREKARAITGGKAPKAKPAAATARPASGKAGDHDPKAVRAWAAENGVTCPAMGRVPRTVVEAWRAAQKEAS